MGRVLVKLSLMLALATITSGAACQPLDERNVGIRRADTVYVDHGRAPRHAPMRALVALSPQNEGDLDALLTDLYDPHSPTFRRYLTATEASRRYGPSAQTRAAALGWAERARLVVAHTSSNGLLLELEGEVDAFEEAFATQLHLYQHVALDFETLGTPGGVVLPKEISVLASLDAAVKDGDPIEPSDAQDLGTAAENVGMLPKEVARTYGLSALAARGARGRGATIGVISGGGIDTGDVATFTKTFDIPREAIEVRELLGPPPRLAHEVTVNAAWAAALAPEAHVIVFQAPDPRTTSLLFAFAEAATTGEATVVTTSYSHVESSEPIATRELYELFAKLGAAIGTTIVAAAGNAAKPDIPATCPHVTSVGGTRHREGTEEAWERSGSGASSFDAPTWQRAVSPSPRRIVSDVALNASSPYVGVWRSKLRSVGGTSISAPIFSAIVAAVNSERLARGAPPVGFLNATLYGDARVQASFADVTTGGTKEHLAGPGWDPPTGWGAPRADALADSLP